MYEGEVDLTNFIVFYMFVFVCLFFFSGAMIRGILVPVDDTSQRVKRRRTRGQYLA